MKILLSAFSCDPSRGSEGGNGWNWACELAKAGHNVWVLTSPSGKSAIETFLASTPVPNLEIVFIDPPRLPSFLGQFRLLLQCLRWQWQALEVGRRLDARVAFDVLHHVTWASLHVGSQLWRIGKPFVFGPVGGGQVANLTFYRYFRGGLVLEVLRSVLVSQFTGSSLFNARSTALGAALVLVTNYETLDWVKRLKASRIEFMLDVGIPKSLLVESSSRRRGDPRFLKILWVGRLLPRKGVLLALESLARISADVHFSCTIIGDGKQGRYLPRWISRLGLSNRVCWRGQVSWAEALEAYLTHDVFLFTSLRDTSASQLLEAMARGLPVVTLDHQGARVVVPANAGIKVPVSTPKQTANAIAQALEQLARDPANIVNMARSGMSYAAQHTWERKAAHALTLYSKLGGTSLQDITRGEHGTT